jgi:hypothetical protein
MEVFFPLLIHGILKFVTEVEDSSPDVFSDFVSGHNAVFLVVLDFLCHPAERVIDSGFKALIGISSVALVDLGQVGGFLGQSHG